MSFFRKLLAMMLMLILGAGLVGCAESEGGDGGNQPAKPDKSQVEQDETRQRNEELAKLLPGKKGFRWIYNGFAEYAHTMDLERIEKEDGQIKYFIKGEVEDMSGGESDRDFSLQVEYVIKDGVLVQKKKEQVMLDSISNDLQLLRTPLDKGAKWRQQVTDKEGNTYDLHCQITEITGDNGAREYTVIYDDSKSDYFEKRKIREGVGVVSLEKMLKSGGESFVAGYTLNEEASGYK